MRRKTLPLILLACLALPLTGAGADTKALESDLAGKTARRQKYERVLPEHQSTLRFLNSAEGKAFYGETEAAEKARFMQEIVDGLVKTLSEAKADEERAAAALSQARQESSSARKDAPVREEPLIDESLRGSAEAPPAAEKEKSARVADDHLKTSSLSGSGSSLSGMAKSAQRLADQLGQGGLKVGAEDFAGKPLKEGGTPPRETGRQESAAGIHTSRPDSMRPLDPSRPAGPRELAVSEVSGFKDSFQRQGLRVLRRADGSVSIVDRSGRPATPEQLEALRRDISSQPAALMRYPDFFSILAPERFQGLKERYRQGEEKRGQEFKDVGMTEAERDFKWDKSCDKVSGECNPNAEAGSYKKDDFVPPKDLDSIWDEVEKEEKRQEEIAARRTRASPGPQGAAFLETTGILDRVQAAFSRILGSRPEEAGSEETLVPEAGAGEAAAARGSAQARAHPASGAQPGPSGRTEARGRKLSKPVRLGLVLAALALIFLGLLRRRQASLRDFFRRPL
jgi:hypothetical protein